MKFASTTVLLVIGAVSFTMNFGRAAETGIKPQITVETSQLVNIPAWAEKAAKLAAEWQPKIGEILGDAPDAPMPPVKLTFKEGQGVAATSRNAITVFAGWVRSHPEDIGLVVHELTHVVQAYPKADPGWVTEGLADYIRFWHYEKTPQTRINKAKASYRDSYRTTGAFFAWVEKQYPGFVKKLHQAMRQTQYNDQIFVQVTGKTVEALWGEFIAQWKDCP